MTRRGEPRPQLARALRAPDQRFDEQCAAWGIVATYTMCSGEPRIVGRHVRVRDLAERFLAGESVAELAEDFGLAVQQVEDALRFAMSKEGLRCSWRDRQLTTSAREGT